MEIPEIFWTILPDLALCFVGGLLLGALRTVLFDHSFRPQNPLDLFKRVSWTDGLDGPVAQQLVQRHLGKWSANIMGPNTGVWINLDKAHARFREYGDATLRYWHPDCYVEDWRLMEVAVEFDLDPDLVWEDGLSRGLLEPETS